MKMGKGLMVASIMAITVAMSLPAAAAAGTFWTAEGEFEASGEYAWISGALITGPGVIHLQVTLFNAVEHGEGEVTAAEVTGPVPMNLPGCSADVTANPASLPWPITLSTPDSLSIGSEASPATLVYHFTEKGSSGCPLFGLPSTLPITGVITGTVENAEEGVACINLNNQVDDLREEAIGLGPVDLTTPTDDLCIEGTEA